MDLLKLFTREEPIAGIEISDSCLRLALLAVERQAGESALGIKVLAEKNLPQGIVAGGRIKDKDGFIRELSGLLKEVKTEIRYAVASIQPHSVYSKLFSFPKTVSGEKMGEAMKTAAGFQMPFNLKDFYIDWEKIESKEENFAFLASAPKSAADEYAAALLAAGVRPVAVEFHPMSIVRSLKISAAGPVMLLIFYRDAVSVSVVENKIIVFSRLLPVLFLGSKGALEEEIRKIGDFFEAEKKKKISTVIFAGSGEKGFGGLKKINLPVASAEIVAPFSADARIKKDESSWLAVLGAALRGAVPRSEDNLVSLMAVGTEEAYENQKAIAFTEFLTHAAIGISIFFVAVFFGTWILMITLGKNFNSRVTALSSLPSSVNAGELESQARDFNELAARAGGLLGDMPNWSVFLEELKSRVTTGININSLSLPSPTDQMTVTGVATNRNQINLFKKSLEGSAYLKEVTLPLTNLAQKENIPFAISFRLKDPASLTSDN